MLRARRLVTLWQRAQPATDASLQRLSMRLACVNAAPASVLPQRRWMSSEGMNNVPFETDENMTKLLAELDTYRETGKWRQALKLLDRVDKDDALPALDPAMYERAIASCARMGKVEVLPGLLNNMLVDDLTPTSATMDFIIQAYLAKEHWGLIVQMASEATALGVQLSPAAFHAIMEACGQIKDADSALSIMKQLSEAGMPLTIDHYAAAIRAAGMGKRPDTAMALFVQMEEQDGLQDSGEAFSQLIRAQVLNGELEQALQSFATVSQRGLSLNEPIYTSTIDSLVSNGKHWQATRLFEQMLEGGEKHPSVFCLGRAMLAYTGANRSQHAWACWNKIVEINEPNPVPMKYNKMLQGLTHVRDTQLAVKVFDHIQTLFESSQIHQGAYTTAIRAHGRLGNTQRAVDLFDEYVESCKDTRRVSQFVGIYLALFNALSRDTVRDPALNTRDAKRAWRIMSANVPVVLPPAYASLAGVFASTGEMETLEELIEHAERSWGASSDVMLQQEVDEDGYELEAVAVFEGEDADLGSENDVLLFNGVISGLCKARDDQTANIEAYLDMMLSRGLPITDSIVRATTDACVRFENWGLMRNLMKMLDVDALKSAEVCTGDTVSKLLDAGMWSLGREWLMFCHRHGLHPPVRRKMELLREMRENKSREWRIAYSLATETMSFRRLVQNNVNSVADAAEVCKNADRMDLVTKLFDAAAGHSSLRFFRNHQRQVQAGRDASQPLKLNAEPVIVPLSLYKNAILALLRQPKTEAVGVDDSWRMKKAERICRQMLEVHGKHLDGEALSMAISIKATAGDHDDVGALYESMRALGLEPNSYAQNAAIIAFSRQRRTDQVLAIRDELMAKRDENGEIETVESNVAKSLLLSLALAHEDNALRDAVQNLPGCTMEMALDVLMNTNRSTDAVEFFNESASSKTFEALFHQLCQSGNPVLGATLLLKHSRLHGLNQVHPNRVIRVTNALIEKGGLVEAEKLLQMYVDGTNGVSLKQTPPYFQQHTMEMLLFIYGEFGHFDAMRSLFEKELLAFPLEVAHYEAAMEYCAESRDELAGAVASLKLFEMLRTHGFIRPSGYTYLLTLQSCLRLERLEPANASAVKSTGQIILDDVREHGFQETVVDELAKQVSSAIKRVQVKNQKVIRRIKKEGDSTDANILSEEELARIALFCHRHGMPMTTKLVSDLLKLHQHLPTMISHELAFVKRSLEEGLGVVTAPGSSIPSKRVVKTKKKTATSKTKRVPALFAPNTDLRRPRSKSYEAAVRAATDARWGVVLEPIGTDKD
ncbi:hypothetical protein JG687_00000708 [Phytophthora cactorum]|uniref:Pentatricopeptide repeat n=1 Tax=Phytophthora cactorum TaxID=29920 RepID=A0A8T1UZ73_9STRA|nr:hypothetical protein PC123_g6862 [Phytophthora cactorum]KAG6973724.1 hypothetical protein JG687_00000708 [Phytophthora cactorum]